MKAFHVLRNQHISMVHKIYFFLRELVLPSSIIDTVLPKNGTILDLGCGIGPITLYLALSSTERRLIGWDISKTRIEAASKIAKKFPNLSFELKDAGNKISIKNLKGAVASDFFHHVSFDKQEKIVQNVSEALGKNGVFVIKEVDNSEKIRSFFSLVWDKILYPSDTSYFRTKEDWIKLLRKYKFNVTAERKISWFPDSTTLFICKKNVPQK